MLNFYRAVSSLSISLLINTLVSARLGRGFQNEASAPANTTGVTWIYPSRSTSTAFNTVDTLVAQWTSSYQEPILTLWCREDVGGALKQSMILDRPSFPQSLTNSFSQNGAVPFQPLAAIPSPSTTHSTVSSSATCNYRTRLIPKMDRTLLSSVLAMSPTPLLKPGLPPSLPRQRKPLPQLTAWRQRPLLSETQILRPKLQVLRPPTHRPQSRQDPIQPKGWGSALV